MLFLALCLAAEPERPAVPWIADEAAYTVRRLSEHEAEVRMTYRFSALDDRWAEQRIADPALRVLQVTGPASRGPGGVYAVLDPARRVHTVELVARADLRHDRLDLEILPAARQSVQVDAPGFVAKVQGALDGALANASRLSVTLSAAAPRPPREERPIVLAEMGAAGWVADGSLHVRSQVRWTVTRGEVPVFRARLPALQELEVTGANLARWERSGDTLVLHPKGPVRGRFEVLVEGRLPAPTTPTRLPAPEPLDVLRTSAWWAVGRADEGELVPSPGRRGIALRQVPEWARGLSDTPAVAFWEGKDPIEVRAARFEPAPGPDAVVERASFVVITNADGRALIRGTWLVRNDRRQFLALSPPEGFEVMTARVSSEATGLLEGPGGAVLVPLPRSLETVKGLVAVPVEVIFLGETDPWATRGDREVLAPGVDAPVQEVRWEVHLPRGYRSRGEVAPAPPVYDPRQEAAQAMLDRAVVAYQNNEFDAARAALDEMKRQELTNEDTARLEGNLDVLQGEAGATDLSARRVRELANARTFGLQAAQAEAEAKAEDALRKGDTEAAEGWLEQVVTLGEKIAPTEQVESGEQAGKLDYYGKKLAEVKEKNTEPAPAASAPVSSVIGGLVGSKSSGSLGSRGSGGGGTAEGVGVTRSTARPPPKDDPPPAEEGEFDGAAIEVPEAAIVMNYRRAEDEPAPPPTAPAPVAREQEERGFAGAARNENTWAMEEEGAEPQAAEVLDKDLLARIPAGRSYQAVESSAAGVVAADPVTGTFSQNFNFDAAEATQDGLVGGDHPDQDAGLLGGRLAEPAALPDAEHAESAVDDDPGPLPRDPQEDFDVEDRRREVIKTLQQRTEQDHPGRPRGLGLAVTADLPAGPDEPEVPRARRPEPKPPPPRKPIDACSRARELNIPLPPGCDGAADELRVDASAFTVALPLDGPSLGATQALLAAGQLATLTLHYRPDPEDRP